MLMVGMHGDNLGKSGNEIRALLEPMDVRGQADEVLEIRIALPQSQWPLFGTASFAAV